jgi:hypothetical protein
MSGTPGTSWPKADNLGSEIVSEYENEIDVQVKYSEVTMEGGLVYILIARNVTDQKHGEGSDCIPDQMKLWKSRSSIPGSWPTLKKAAHSTKISVSIHVTTWRKTVDCHLN